MPRNYTRKTTRGAGGRWSLEDLAKAMEHVQKGLMTTVHASKAFNVPRSTLGLKLKGWKGKNPRNTTEAVINGGGRVTFLTKYAEERLAKNINVMNKWGFGLSKSEVLDIVQQFVTENKIKTSFKDNRPSNDWWINFASRWNISLKKPERLEGSRARQAGDPFVFRDFYDKLTGIIKSLGLEDKPEAIFNCDETGFNLDPGPTKVASSKGQAAKRVTGGSGRDYTTVLACVSADGGKMPPMILHKGKRMWDTMIGNNAYPDTSYFISESGWMTEEVFTSWFKKVFLKNVKMFPCVLIYDGHLSHIGVNLVEEAVAANVTIMKLPPHTSHLLQPLDVSVFRGVKSRWDAFLTEWSRHNYGVRLDKSTFANLLGKTWHTILPETIRAGFKKTGIYDHTLQFPVNPTAISDDNYDHDKLARFKLQQTFSGRPTQEHSQAVDLGLLPDSVNEPGNQPSVSRQSTAEKRISSFMAH